MSDSKEEKKGLSTKTTYELNELEQILTKMELFNTVYESYKLQRKKVNVAEVKEEFSKLETIFITLQDLSSKANLGHTLKEVKTNAYSALMDLGMEGGGEEVVLNTLRAIYKLSPEIDRRCQQLNITSTIEKEKRSPGTIPHHYGESPEILFAKKPEKITETASTSTPEVSKNDTDFRRKCCLIS